jgi:hypothetical protein
VAAVLTYDSLVSDMVTYSERVNDEKFAEAVPRLIMYAENRLATDLKTEGTEKIVTGTFDAGSPVLAKPAFWRDTISFQVTRADGSTYNALPRAYEYCRTYWPAPAKTVAYPRFYADYGFDHFYLAGTPATALAFELSYHARQDPLDDGNQTNWLTVGAPQLLFYAAMLEAQLWLKNDDKIVTWGNMYKDALSGLDKEDSGRRQDATTVPE